MIDWLVDCLVVVVGDKYGSRFGCGWLVDSDFRFLFEHKQFTQLHDFCFWFFFYTQKKKIKKEEGTKYKLVLV